MASYRFLEITPGFGDVSVVTSISGSESLARPFRFELEVLSKSLDLEAKDVLGRNYTLRIDRGADSDGNTFPPRYINGYISFMRAGDTVEYAAASGKEAVYRSYHAVMMPWLWFLTKASRCYIFFPGREKKSVYDIVEKVLTRAGEEFHFHPDYELDGISDLRNRMVEHCVQYRETDFNFLSRILEQYGVYYYFRHEETRHVMVLETKKNYPECEESEVDFPHTASSSRFKHDHITNWGRQFEFVSGRWQHGDYDFQQPLLDLRTISPQDQDVVMLSNNSGYELYDFPGEYVEKADGEKEAVVRMQAEESQHHLANGSSTCKSFTPGYRFKLKSHPSCANEVGKKYVLTSVKHMATQPGPETSPEYGTHYTNTFSCIPAQVQYRPARITPKPVVSGVQTAVVTGPKGEEIYTDKYGRVKVHFHWDREGREIRTTEGENCSCWIRVAHHVAGRKWGFLAIPRIGQEVVVEFIEGDPDRPLVTGSVYNEDQMPHYELPKEQARSYIKTNSSKGGEGFNELMFDDRHDEERVFLHAQKDIDIRALNDSKSRIFGNQHQVIGWEKDGKKGGDQRELVYEDKHLNVKRHQFEHIEGNLQLMIGHGEADEGGNLDLVIEKKKTELIEGDSDLIVKGNHKEKFAGTLSTTVTGDQHTKVAGNIAMESGSMGEIHLKSGMKVIIETGMQLSLVGPGGFINLGPDGITIQGLTVKINSGGAAGAGSGCKPEEPQEAKQAAPAKPQLAWNSASGMKSAPS